MNIVWSLKDYSNNEGWELDSFSVTGDVPEVIEEFKIPSVVDGKHILGISTMRASFVNLLGRGVKQIKRVIVEDGVEYVANWAFSQIPIKIDEFYWPATCNTIPHGCFYCSPVKAITGGIKDVTEIGATAFDATELETFVWPSKCKVIPEDCFCNCVHLMKISGIDNVTKIGHCAFAVTKLSSFDWPAKCKHIPEGCFFLTPIKEINNIEHVTQIGLGAFKETSIIKFTWPSKCKIIPTDCFFNAPLEEIHGIENVEKIGSEAFGGTLLQTFIWPLKVKVPAANRFSSWGLKNCKKLRKITFAENTGIQEVDLNALTSLKNIEIIDLSKVAVVNFINTNSKVETSILYEKIKDKLRLPYYVAGI